MKKRNIQLIMLLQFCLLSSCGRDAEKNHSTAAAPDYKSETIPINQELSYKDIVEALTKKKQSAIEEDYSLVAAPEKSPIGASDDSAVVPSDGRIGGSTYFSSRDYASQAPEGLGYSSLADRTAVGAVYAWRESLKRHDNYQAAKDAQAVLDNAYLTGDPEAVMHARSIREATRRVTGY